VESGRKACHHKGCKGEWKGYRNGSRTRKLKTVNGELELKKSQIREFPFETKVFDRYSRVEKAMDSVILES
jgi:putative transposase